MFGLFDGIQKSVENAIDVGIGVMTLGEYGDFSKSSVSKMIADGIELAIVAEFYGTTVDIIEEMVKD